MFLKFCPQGGASSATTLPGHGDAGSGPSARSLKPYRARVSFALGKVATGPVDESDIITLLFYSNFNIDKLLLLILLLSLFIDFI